MTSKHPQRCETCVKYSVHTKTRIRFCDGIVIPGCGEDACAFEWVKTHGCASHSSASEPAPEPNPCEENGCTDIENCDEICEHMRIYSPAYVRESRQKARKEVLDELAEPTIRASEEAEKNGDYVSQTCYEDVLKWIAAIRQQEGKR